MRRLSMLLIVLGTLIACGEAQGAGWVFHEPEVIDPGAGLTGVACPAKNLCIAVDHGVDGSSLRVADAVCCSRRPRVGFRIRRSVGRGSQLARLGDRSRACTDGDRLPDRNALRRY